MRSPDCLILGGSGAIGRAILNLLAQRDVGRILATSSRQHSDGADAAMWFTYSALCSESHVDLARRISHETDAVGAMVYCIGAPSSKATVVDTPFDEWERLLRINTLAFVHVYSALKEVLRRGHARVVVISSDTTLRMNAGNGPYTASKCALESICQTLAKEEAEYGVRVNVLAPSLVDSPLAAHVLSLKQVVNVDAYVSALPWRRMLKTSEVAELAVSLMLDKYWDYATGNTYHLGANIQS